MVEVIYAMFWCNVDVPNNPKMHWLDSLGWIMVEFMNVHVINAILAKVFAPNYVALTCDEVSTMDNGSWISIHAHVMQHWAKVPMLNFLQRVVDGLEVDNVTIIIIEALQKGGGLSYAS
jgi:hypothetical protein